MTVARTVFMAWELGGGTGHVMRMKPIAEALRAREITIVFAVRELTAARPLVEAGFDVLLAPRVLDGLPTHLLAFNHAELLIRAGYGQLANVQTIIASWRALIETVAADLVVADFAPSALLGAIAAGVRAITVGTGFALPPPETPLPSVRPWQPNPAARMAAAERDVTLAINAAMAGHGRPAIPNLGAALNTGRDILCVFPELDHFQRPSATVGDYVGPIFSTPHGRTPPWPDAGGERIFAYLDAAAGSTAELAQALKNSGRAVLLVVRGRSRTDLGALAGPRFAVTDQPVDLGAALSAATVAVCHGGMGLVSQALLAGVPLIIKPENPEQRGTALRVAGFGAAVALPPRAKAADAANALGGALGSPGLTSAAQAFGRRYSDFRVEAAIERVVDRVTSALP